MCGWGLGQAARSQNRAVADLQATPSKQLVLGAAFSMVFSYVVDAPTLCKIRCLAHDFARRYLTPDLWTNVHLNISEYSTPLTWHFSLPFLPSLLRCASVAFRWDQRQAFEGFKVRRLLSWSWMCFDPPYNDDEKGKVQRSATGSEFVAFFEEGKSVFVSSLPVTGRAQFSMRWASEKNVGGFDCGLQLEARTS